MCDRGREEEGSGVCDGGRRKAQVCVIGGEGGRRKAQVCVIGGGEEEGSGV